MFKKLVFVAVSTLSALATSASYGNEMAFVSGGGPYQESVTKAWIDPFSKLTGISVIQDTNPEIAKVKAMVDTNSVSWDVMTGSGNVVGRGIEAGLYEELTPAILKQDHIIPQIKLPYAVPAAVYSTVMAYSTKQFPSTGPQPRTFADFWDVKRFPGKRSMSIHPQTMLEIALLADGVLHDKVYATLETKEGLNRAFEKIKEIKPHVSLWWQNGVQPVQALGSGEVTMALGWNGPIQAGIKQKLPIAIAWDQSILQVTYMMIIKNAPNKDAAIKFLNYVSTPAAQAELSKYIDYGPTTLDAMPLIDEDRKARLPSSPDRLKNALFLDVGWWARRGTDVTEKFLALLQR